MQIKKTYSIREVFEIYDELLSRLVLILYDIMKIDPHDKEAKAKIRLKLKDAYNDQMSMRNIISRMKIN